MVWGEACRQSRCELVLWEHTASHKGHLTIRRRMTAAAGGIAWVVGLQKLPSLPYTFCGDATKSRTAARLSTGPIILTTVCVKLVPSLCFPSTGNQDAAPARPQQPDGQRLTWAPRWEPGEGHRILDTKAAGVVPLTKLRAQLRIAPPQYSSFCMSSTVSLLMSLLMSLLLPSSNPPFTGSSQRCSRIKARCASPVDHPGPGSSNRQALRCRVAHTWGVRLRAAQWHTPQRCWRPPCVLCCGRWCWWCSTAGCPAALRSRCSCWQPAGECCSLSDASLMYGVQHWSCAVNLANLGLVSPLFCAVCLELCCPIFCMLQLRPVSLCQESACVCTCFLFDFVQHQDLFAVCTAVPTPVPPPQAPQQPAPSPGEDALGGDGAAAGSHGVTGAGLGGAEEDVLEAGPTSGAILEVCLGGREGGWGGGGCGWAEASSVQIMSWFRRVAE